MSPLQARPAALPERHLPADLSGWVERLCQAPMPVLRSSALALEELRLNEDAVDAHLLAESFGTDPLMILKVLSEVARLRQGHDGSDPETLTSALVMLGITPFFRAFGPQADLEACLASMPGALDGARRVLLRGQRAARFAGAFAVQRLDLDAAVLQEAALLHDFADLLMWIHAPGLCAELERQQQADPGLRTAEAQAGIFGVRLPELQHALMLRWRLPPLLIDLSDDSLAPMSSQARTVVLATRLARHTALGWDNPALADDVREIAGLLHMAEQPTENLLRDVDEGWARGP